MPGELVVLFDVTALDSMTLVADALRDVRQIVKNKLTEERHQNGQVTAAIVFVLLVAAVHGQRDCTRIGETEIRIIT